MALFQSRGFWFQARKGRGALEFLPIPNTRGAVLVQYSRPGPLPYASEEAAGGGPMTDAAQNQRNQNMPPIAIFWCVYCEFS